CTYLANIDLLFHRHYMGHQKKQSEITVKRKERRTIDKAFYNAIFTPCSLPNSIRNSNFMLSVFSNPTIAKAGNHMPE
ncbi:MAG: hypothetical protein JSV96_08490, partial [Candidatus Aminicenantes bacterium]